MSFLPNSTPKLIFFCCLDPVTQKGQGETPLTDMRAVWKDLNPKTKKKFEEKGVMNIRNYSGKSAKNAKKSFSLRNLDPFRTKSWEDIFETTNKELIKDMCDLDDVKVKWKGGSDDLQLTNTHPAFRVHPLAGTTAWANHSQVFHIDSIPSEYHRVSQRQHRLVLC